MSDNVFEQYEIKTEDSDLHAMAVMTEVLMRHISSVGQDCTSEEYEEQLKRRRVMCCEFVLERMKA